MSGAWTCWTPWPGSGRRSSSQQRLEPRGAGKVRRRAGHRLRGRGRKAGLRDQARCGHARGRRGDRPPRAAGAAGGLPVRRTLAPGARRARGPGAGDQPRRVVPCCPQNRWRSWTPRRINFRCSRSSRLAANWGVALAAISYGQRGQCPCSRGLAARPKVLYDLLCFISFGATFQARGFPG